MVLVNLNLWDHCSQLNLKNGLYMCIALTHSGKAGTHAFECRSAIIFNPGFVTLDGSRGTEGRPFLREDFPHWVRSGWQVFSGSLPILKLDIAEDHL